MNATAEPPLLNSYEMRVKAVLSMLPCFFFLYVNAVMMFSLLMKPVFLESSRYVLFGHLLLTESLQLTMTLLLYLFAVTAVKVATPVCIPIILLASISLQISPLNLALMSLERYVAICFPLRHPSIATSRATAVGIGVIWALASMNSVTQLLLVAVHQNANIKLESCSSKSLFRLPISLTLNRGFIIVYLVIVSIIIVYTYIAVLVTVRSASSDARKAHKTVLLHLFQFGLSLTSTLFGMINSKSGTLNTQYILFLLLLVFPKFLSPFIYGLRDPSFSLVFKFYFMFGLKAKVKPFSKSDVLTVVS